MRLCNRNRVGDNGARVDCFIIELINKRGIGTVFQQSPHQIGQKLAVRANRGIDAAGHATLLHQKIVLHLTHAMKPLKLESAVLTCHVQNGNASVHIVGGKVRIDAGRVQQFSGRCQISYICVLFTGKHGETGKAHHLRPLDLHVPVGTLHQPHHQIAVIFFRQGFKPLNFLQSPLAISLHHHAKAVPAAHGGVGNHLFKNIKGEVKAIRLFRIHIQAKIIALCHASQNEKPIHKRWNAQLFLGKFIAGMKRGQFDRNARIGDDLIASLRLAKRLNRLDIGFEIMLGVFFGQRRFPKHVIGIGIAFFHGSAAVFKRALNGLAKHKLPAHDLHGLGRCQPHHRLAQAMHKPMHQLLHAGLFFFFEDLASERQGPCGTVHKARARAAKVGRPLMRGKLIGNQGISGFRVWHAQEGFCQGHQRQTLLGGKAIFAQKGIHQAGLAFAHRHNQLCRLIHNAGTRL